MRLKENPDQPSVSTLTNSLPKTKFETLKPISPGGRWRRRAWLRRLTFQEPAWSVSTKSQSGQIIISKQYSSGRCSTSAKVNKCFSSACSEVCLLTGTRIRSGIIILMTFGIRRNSAEEIKLKVPSSKWQILYDMSSGNKS